MINTFNLKKYSGFTLAEVLITLLIIGVVASLLVPNLINNSQNAEFYVAAKKAFATASQSYKLSVLNNGGGFGEYAIVSSTSAFNKFNAIKSNLNVIQECPFNSNIMGNCWASTGVGKGDTANCARFAIDNQNYNSSFKTSDGMYWMLYSYSATYGLPWIAVDINGEKKPNDWGKDVFIFEIHDTVLKPMTYNCGAPFKHNDGTMVVIPTEFQAPFQ